MGIYDRDYIRDEDSKAARRADASTPAVYLLLAVTGLVVFLEVFGNVRNERSPFFYACSFSVAKFQAGEIWRAATYPIVCDHPMAYLFELCVLLIFGRPFERRFGPVWLLGVYFGSAVAAALGVWAFMKIGMLAGIEAGDLFSGPTTALLGLLGAVLFTIGRQMTELHLPTPMSFEMRWAALAAAVVGLLAVADTYWRPHQRFIAVFGFCAGMTIGKAASLLSERRRADDERPRWSRRRDDEPIVVKFPGTKSKAAADDVDDLLAKISERGMDSLTAEERSRLDAASASKRRRKGEG